MYILKNAFRCIGRSKGRNILIGIIALVIAVSACLGLSIRQASESAKQSTMEGLTITASISYDRSSVINNMTGGRPGGGQRPGGDFDRNQFADMFSGASTGLTLEQYQTYAGAESVQDFYYTLTASFNGTDTFLPFSNETEEETEENTESENESNPGFGGFGGMGFPGGMGGMNFNTADFSVVGYSSYNAMTAFINGTAAMVDDDVSTMFTEGTDEMECVISEELAAFNNLAVGDTITLTNPSVETETYDLKVVGFYTSSAEDDFSLSGISKSLDSANRIYMSATALQAILDKSDEVSTTITENNREKDSAVTGSVSATYVFADTESYYAFEEQVRAMGLEESYIVSSSDISAYENSLVPLETLSKMAGWFLLVILLIGGIILVVLNIFNVRERKYEVGVLTAMGMKKWKVATQFICEILVVTMIAVIIGAAIGAVSSVPVTNALLAGQVESQQSRQNKIEDNFGRPGDMGSGFPGGMGGMGGMTPPDMPGDMGGGKNPFGEMFDGAANYITEVNSAMNLTVVFQMLGVGLLLTIVASTASVLFIMRYDPLKILANRD